MSKKTFITTGLTWDDGDYETNAESAKEAAVYHAVEGWENGGDSDDEREAVIIQVTDDSEDVTKWKVDWVRVDRVVGRKKVESWRALAIQIE